jgi:hypothetical protein
MYPLYAAKVNVVNLTLLSPDYKWMLIVQKDIKCLIGGRCLSDEPIYRTLIKEMAVVGITPEHVRPIDVTVVNRAKCDIYNIMAIYKGPLKWTNDAPAEYEAFVDVDYAHCIHACYGCAWINTDYVLASRDLIKCNDILMLLSPKICDRRALRAVRPRW